MTIQIVKYQPFEGLKIRNREKDKRFSLLCPPAV